MELKLRFQKFLNYQVCRGIAYTQLNLISTSSDIIHWLHWIIIVLSLFFEVLRPNFLLFITERHPAIYFYSDNSLHISVLSTNKFCWFHPFWIKKLYHFMRSFKIDFKMQTAKSETIILMNRWCEVMIYNKTVVHFVRREIYIFLFLLTFAHNCLKIWKCLLVQQKY